MSSDASSSSADNRYHVNVVLWMSMEGAFVLCVERCKVGLCCGRRLEKSCVIIVLWDVLSEPEWEQYDHCDVKSKSVASIR